MKHSHHLALAGLFMFSGFIGLSNGTSTQADVMTNGAVINTAALAKSQYGNDAGWYLANIPFVDLPDAQIQEIYYYRWGTFKRHLRDVGPKGTIITEFLPHVGWEGPDGAINAAVGHHIYEGRWLRDRKPVENYIDFWYRGGGGRNYSMWLADAVLANYLVDGNRTFATDYLPEMQDIYEEQKGRFDASKGLYWIAPTNDATEFTTAALDVGDGWRGDSFRPTINSYQYGDARAISALAELAGDIVTSGIYSKRAAILKTTVQNDLWNPQFNQFMDRFNDHYPDRYFQFASGPELAGYVPWYFNLPDTKYLVAWSKLTDPKQLLGKYGLRTVLPTSPYYMVQHRTPGQQPGECEWNGPSWPYQTSQVLTGMANVLNGPAQTVVNKADYFMLLKQYATQQYKDGHPWIAEDLNPDTGQWIADYPNRSEFYNHSTYNDLILSGLLGVRPRADNTLELNPLVPADWRYFAAEDIPYHGHLISFFYDADGKHYKQGLKNFNLFVDGKAVATNKPLGHLTAQLPNWMAAPLKTVPPSVINYAYNANGRDFPQATASFSAPNTNPAEANDGRVWYDATPHNRWSAAGSGNATDWYAVDFGAEKPVDSAQLYFYSDGQTLAAPKSYTIQYWNGTAWADVPHPLYTPNAPLAGTANIVMFPTIKTSKLRVVLTHQSPTLSSGLVEFEAFGPNQQTPREANLYEAERATVNHVRELSVASASAGSYIGGIDFDDSYVQFNHVKAPKTGSYNLVIRYANGIGGPSTHLLTINGATPQTVPYPATSGWGAANGWQEVSISVPLLAGNNVLKFSKGTQFAELDSIRLVSGGQ